MMRLTGEERFKAAAQRAAAYLLSGDARPEGYAFGHFREARRGRGNGLVGQAWTFEALAEAHRTLGGTQYLQAARDVFFQHPFDEGNGLWSRIEIDGTILPDEPTFNQQLWFAASASALATDDDSEIMRRIRRFLDRLPGNVTIFEDGLVFHHIVHLWEKQLTARGELRRWATRIVDAVRMRPGMRTLTGQRTVIHPLAWTMHRSVGYHAFNMCAFATLKSRFDDHPFWNTPAFKQAVRYAQDPRLRADLTTNIYGFPYNVPGFEVPYALSKLGDLQADEWTATASWWINEQFSRCYNPATNMLDRNTEDPATLTARLYECLRLPSTALTRIEVDDALLAV